MSAHSPAVKICGVCRVEDARLALAAGADLVGVIVHGPGPRAQGSVRAAAILDVVPRRRRAGVFVNASVEAVLAAADAAGLAIIQLHGDESVEEVQRIRTATGAQVWKALRPAGRRGFERLAARYAGCADALLLDGGGEGAYGGTGRRFDWSSVADRRSAFGAVPLVVAGGLNAANVAQAVRLLRPAVVDVSSGVESVVGRKSPEQVRAFIAAVRRIALELESDTVR